MAGVSEEARRTIAAQRVHAVRRAGGLLRQAVRAGILRGYGRSNEELEGELMRLMEATMRTTITAEHRRGTEQARSTLKRYLGLDIGSRARTETLAKAYTSANQWFDHIPVLAEHVRHDVQAIARELGRTKGVDATAKEIVKYYETKGVPIDDTYRGYIMERTQHSGRGIYRNAMQNAQRLVRTEVANAYVLAEQQEYQRTGGAVQFYEVVRSGSGDPDCIICEQRKGVYPIDVEFKVWHPNCMCFIVPIIEKRAAAQEDGTQE